MRRRQESGGVERRLGMKTFDMSYETKGIGVDSTTRLKKRKRAWIATRLVMRYQ
jgi:hypothetical protein